MKNILSALVASAALVVLNATPALAVDYDYFKNQSCGELGKELDSLKKAEEARKDSERMMQENKIAMAKLINNIN